MGGNVDWGNSVGLWVSERQIEVQLINIILGDTGSQITHRWYFSITVSKYNGILIIPLQNKFIILRIFPGMWGPGMWTLLCYFKCLNYEFSEANK